ncbi:hypothetical protein Taro_042926 [Colocasia esculenta]|uniref:Phorbol-ester/DAG-type domain-containing protein n=1 Tax=Colocasia esculenta TaxID=4460 RepID=A0A843WJM8_COLES|nr:hypothetical protein [Colocasia esculenta]
MEGHAYAPVMEHFSHPHRLELCSMEQSLAPTTCSCCRQMPSGWTYACRACNYYLHASCAQMSELIRHRAHPDHPLDLLPVSAYPDGCFDCDACGGNGTGFSYHCGDCGLDFHPLCASAPASVTHQGHPHALTLAFSLPPRYTMGFTCDVCGGKGSKCWLYRCADCEFDVHMSCATGKGREQTQVMENQLAQILLGRGRGTGGVDGNGVEDGSWNRFLGVGSAVDISARWGRS